MPTPRLVVMGVSGAGKSAVGAALAAALGVPFVDGDDLHPEANVARMVAGIPLTDADRAPWLERVGAVLAAAPDGLVVACSALRRAYRDAIRAAVPDAAFVHLAGSSELLRRRLEGRAGHFMPAALLDSQLATLEPLAADEAGVALSIESTVDEIAAAAQAWWGGMRGAAPAEDAPT